MWEPKNLALLILGNSRRARSSEVMNYTVLIYPTETQLQAKGYIGANEDDGIYLTPKGWTKYWMLKTKSLKMAARYFTIKFRHWMGG